MVINVLLHGYFPIVQLYLMQGMMCCLFKYLDMQYPDYEQNLLSIDHVLEKIHK